MTAPGAPPPPPPPPPPALCLNNSRVAAPIWSDAPQVNPQRWKLTCGLLVAALALTLASLVAFAAAKPRYARLRVRRLVLVALYAWGVLLYVFAELFLEVYGIARVPCWVHAILDLLIAPNFGALVVARYTVFLLLHRFAVIVYRYGRVDVVAQAVGGGDDDADADADANAKQHPGAHATAAGAAPAPLLVETIETATGRITRTLKNLAWVSSVVWYVVSSLARPEAMAIDVTPEDKRATLERLRFVASRKGAITIVAVCSFPFVVFAFAYVFSDPVYVNCVGCRRDGTLTLIIVGESVFLVGCTIVLALRVRKLRDDWGLITESRITLAWVVIAFVGLLLEAFAPVDPASAYSWQVLICIGLVFAFCTVSILQVFLAALREGWPTWMVWCAGSRCGLRGPPKQPHRASRIATNAIAGGSHGQVQPDAVTTPSRATKSLRNGRTLGDRSTGVSGTNLGGAAASPSSTGTSTAAPTPANVLNVVDAKAAPGLRDILADETLTTEFEEQLLNEFGQEALLFLRAVAEYRAVFFDSTPSARAVRAKRMVRAFVAVGGMFAVNLSHGVRAATTHAVQSPGPDGVSADVFNVAANEVARMMENDSVARFRLRKQKERAAASAGGATSPASPSATSPSASAGMGRRTLVGGGAGATTAAVSVSPTSDASVVEAVSSVMS